MTVLHDEHEVRVALADPALWPNLTQAADIVGVAKSTLSKKADMGEIEHEVLGFGRGRHVLRPEEVMRIGCRYRRVPEATIVARLAAFLAPRLHVEIDVIRRVLLQSLAEVPNHRPAASATSLDGGRPTPEVEVENVPAWLFEVEKLRKDPAALAGSFSFVSSAEIVGSLPLGPPIDDEVETLSIAGPVE